MFKTLLKVAVVVLLALALAELGQEDPGYVLINYSGYVIETSLLIIIAFAVVASIAIYLAAFFLKPIWLQFKGTALSPKQERHQLTLTKGMLALSDGDWVFAEKQLNRMPKNTPATLIALLGSARAAFELGKDDRAQQYLEQALKFDKKNGVKHRHHILLAQAQLAVSKTDYVAAMRSLNKIAASDHNKAYWKMKARVLLHTQQWHQLYALMPKIRQDTLFSDTELLELEVTCFGALMHDQPLETIEEFWKTIPSKRRLLSPLARTKFNALANIGETKLALELAQEQVQRGMDSDWALDLASLTEADWQARYNLITKYMPTGAQSSKALGMLAYQGDKYDVALDHLNEALKQEPSDLSTQLLIFKIEKQSDQAKSPEQQLEILSEKVNSLAV